MKKQTLTAAVVGALAGAAIVHSPVTFESKGQTKSWSDLTRKKQDTIEVNAGQDFRIVACTFPVTVQLRGEVFFKDRPNWPKK